MIILPTTLLALPELVVPDQFEVFLAYAGSDLLYLILTAGTILL